MNLIKYRRFDWVEIHAQQFTLLSPSYSWITIRKRDLNRLSKTY